MKKKEYKTSHHIPRSPLWLLSTDFLIKFRPLLVEYAADADVVRNVLTHDDWPRTTINYRVSTADSIGHSSSLNFYTLSAHLKTQVVVSSSFSTIRTWDTHVCAEKLSSGGRMMGEIESW